MLFQWVIRQLNELLAADWLQNQPAIRQRSTGDCTPSPCGLPPDQPGAGSGRHRRRDFRRM